MALPIGVRARLVQPARQHLADVDKIVIGAVPITPTAWSRAWTDLTVRRYQQQVEDSAAELVTAAKAGDATALRASAARLAAHAADLLEILRAFACFEPGAPSAADHARAVREAALDLLDRCAANAHADPLQLPSLDVVERNGPSENIDVWEAAMGVPSSTLVDQRGRFSRPLLHAAFHGRRDYLLTRLQRLTAMMTDELLQLSHYFTIVEALLNSPSPVLAAATAFRVRAMIDRAAGEDTPRTVDILIALAVGVDRSAANFSRIKTTIRSIDLTDDQSVRAGLELELYRQIIEGQFRPWAWTTLQLLGGDGRTPEVGRLRQMLAARSEPIAQSMAAPMLAAARNAAAHEDYHYSHERKALIADGETVDLVDLRARTSQASSIVGGAEAGWVWARAQLPALISPFDRGDPPSRAMTEAAALDEIGANGLRIVKWRHTDALFSVEVERLTRHLVNPAFQALLWAARYLAGPSNFEMSTAAGAAISLDRDELHRTDPIWFRAWRWFPYMPTSVFLDLNLRCRLAIEDPVAADQAIAWLLLNDPLTAVIEATEQGCTSHAWVTLHRRLAIAVLGGGLAQDSLGELSRGRLFQACRRVETLLAAVNRRDRRAVDRAEARVRDIWEGLTVPSILPTWNPNVRPQLSHV